LKKLLQGFFYYDIIVIRGINPGYFSLLLFLKNRPMLMVLGSLIFSVISRTKRLVHFEEAGARDQKEVEEWVNMS